MHSNQEFRDAPHKLYLKIPFHNKSSLSKYAPDSSKLIVVLHPSEVKTF